MRDHFGNIPIVDGMGFSRGIMLLDDCEGTFTYTVGGTGGDDVHEFATAAAWQGEKGIHLKTRVTGTAENDVVYASKMFDYPLSGLLVARARISPVSIANTKSLRIDIRLDDGTQQYDFVIALQISAGTVSYVNAAGVLTAIAALATTFLAGAWYTVELTIDALTKTYRTVRFNGFEADLSAQGGYNDAASVGRQASIGLWALASAAGAGDGYFDNIYVGEYLDA